MRLLHPRPAYLALIVLVNISASLAAVHQSPSSYNSLTPRSASSDSLQLLQYTDREWEAEQDAEHNRMRRMRRGPAARIENNLIIPKSRVTSAHSLQPRVFLRRALKASADTVIYFCQDYQNKNAYVMTIAMHPTLTSTINNDAALAGNVQAWWSTMFTGDNVRTVVNRLGIDDSSMIHTRGTKIELDAEGSTTTYRGCIIFYIRKPIHPANSNTDKERLNVILATLNTIVYNTQKVYAKYRSTHDPVEHLEDEDRQWVADQGASYGEAPEDMGYKVPIPPAPVARVKPHVNKLTARQRACVYDYQQIDLARMNDYLMFVVFSPKMNEVVDHLHNGNVRSWWEESALHDRITQELFNRFRFPVDEVGLYPTKIEVQDYRQPTLTIYPRISLIIRIRKYPDLDYYGQEVLLYVMNLIGTIQRHQTNILNNGAQDESLFVEDQEVAEGNESNADIVDEREVIDPLAWVEEEAADIWAAEWLARYGVPPIRNLYS